MPSKKEHAASVVASSRAHLKKWLTAAQEHGTIYYEVTSVARSGMSRRMTLATIIIRDGKPELQRLWPTVDESIHEATPGTAGYHANMDIAAKDMRFSFKFRQFVIGGCGMDMVFALIDDLASSAGMPRGYANLVRRESFSNS